MTNVLENIAEDIPFICFRCKHESLFSNTVENLKDRHFTINISLILNLPLCCCLLSVDGILKSASTWYLWRWKISSNEDFWQILLKTERAPILRSMDTESSNFKVRLYFYHNFHKLVLYSQIVITNWYFSAIFICF